MVIERKKDFFLLGLEEKQGARERQFAGFRLAAVDFVMWHHEKFTKMLLIS